MKVKIKTVESGFLPRYSREGDACLDCFAWVSENCRIPSGERKKIPLGFYLELPKGWKATIKPRSGLTLKGIDCAIGTIDSNYRGIVNVTVINNSNRAYNINDGMKICQMEIERVKKIKFKKITKLTPSNRGANGFGSSGV